MIDSTSKSLLLAFTLFVLPEIVVGQESNVWFGTCLENRTPVPLQIVLVGPTYHIIDVMKSNPLTNNPVKLKAGAQYSVKLRFGSRPTFRYHQVGDVLIPQAGKDSFTQIQLEPDKLNVSVTRTETDTSTSRAGNQVTFSGNRRTVTDYAKTYPLTPSDLHMHGFLRDWTSTDGKVIKATYLMVDSNAVALMGIKGQVYRTPIASLSEADREYLKQLSANQLR